jgi:comEA protein
MTALGFTRNEQKVLLFLSACFLAGGAVQIYQNYYQPLPATAANPILSADDGRESSIGVQAGRERTETGALFTVSLNTATQSDLERIPGIGPVTAKRIIGYRDVKGRFGSVDDLLGVKGIGPKKLLKIRPYIKIQ